MTMRFNLRNHGPLRRYASKGSNHKKTETRGLMNSCRPLFEEVYDYAEQNKEAACEALAF